MTERIEAIESYRCDVCGSSVLFNVVTGVCHNCGHVNSHLPGPAAENKHKTRSQMIRYRSVDRWRPFETAPRDQPFDVWAKSWDSKTDQFSFQRFPSCHYQPNGFLMGLTDLRDWRDWHATHWMPIPPGPCVPNQDLRVCWVKKDHAWAKQAGTDAYTVRQTEPADPTKWAEFVEVRESELVNIF